MDARAHIAFGIKLGEPGDSEIPDFLEPYDGSWGEFLLAEYGNEEQKADTSIKNEMEFEEAFFLEEVNYGYECNDFFLAIRGTHQKADDFTPSELTMPLPDISVAQLQQLEVFCEKHGIEYQQPKWWLIPAYG